MPEVTDIILDRNTTHILRFQSINPPDIHSGAIAGWTTSLEIRQVRAGNTVATISGSLSIDVPNASTLGIFDVTVSANVAQTLAGLGRTFYYAFRRTNTGFETVLAKGKLTIESY